MNIILYFNFKSPIYKDFNYTLFSDFLEKNINKLFKKERLYLVIIPLLKSLESKFFIALFKTSCTCSFAKSNCSSSVSTSLSASCYILNLDKIYLKSKNFFY